MQVHYIPDWYSTPSGTIYDCTGTRHVLLMLRRFWCSRDRVTQKVCAIALHVRCVARLTTMRAEEMSFRLQNLVYSSCVPDLSEGGGDEKGGGEEERSVRDMCDLCVAHGKRANSFSVSVSVSASASTSASLCPCLCLPPNQVNLADSCDRQMRLFVTLRSFPTMTAAK